MISSYSNRNQGLIVETCLILCHKVSKGLSTYINLNKNALNKIANYKYKKILITCRILSRVLNIGVGLHSNFFFLIEDAWYTLVSQWSWEWISFITNYPMIRIRENYIETSLFIYLLMPVTLYSLYSSSGISRWQEIPRRVSLFSKQNIKEPCNHSGFFFIMRRY